MSLNQKMMAQWASTRKINLNSPVPQDTTLEKSVTTIPEQIVDSPALATPETPSATKKRKPTSIKEDLPQKRSRTLNSAAAASGSGFASASLSNGIGTDYSPPKARLADLGGIQPCIEKLLELVAMPLRHPEIYLHTGVQPPRGVLLHGPPGCGKTLLANAIAGELQVPFINISAPSIVSGMSGESEKTLRDTFEQAKKIAPCLLFIDEIDAITPKRESVQREMERRIVAQLLTCMDDLSWDKTGDKAVITIGATNRPDALDAALRRAGRFDHEISMNVPDEAGRAQILRVLSSKLRLAGDFDFDSLARQTPGYVGADLAALTGAAGIVAVKRIFQEIANGKLQLPMTPPVDTSENENQNMQLDDAPNTAQTSASDGDQQSVFISATPSIISTISINPSLASNSMANFLIAHPNPLTPEQLEPLHITYADFLDALPTVQPSSKREGFTTIPDVTWSDIGALHTTRDELRMTIVQPILRPEIFKAVGIDAPSGVLLWGPPGCGKTLLAKAVANESRANFISIKGPELLNKYVGESERALRQVFTRARASAPCIIFFDELDALVPRRDDSLSESSARVVNTLLTELDGLDSRKGVHVIAATNRPDIIDPAMCRPGRLDKLLYVDLPNGEERMDIFKALARKLPITEDIAVQQMISELVRNGKFDGFSGADIAALVREAGVVALRRTISVWEVPDRSQSQTDPKVIVGLQDFEHAADKVGPSVSAAQRRKYESLRSKFSGAVPTVKIPEEGNTL